MKWEVLPQLEEKDQVVNTPVEPSLIRTRHLLSSSVNVMSAICGFSYQSNRDRITLFSTQGMVETKIAVTILLDVSELETSTCTLWSWRGSHRVKGDNTALQYTGTNTMHKMPARKESKALSPAVQKNKNPAEKHYSASKRDIWDSVWIARLTKAGWDVFNYWETKTRLILLRSSLAIPSQLCLGCRERWGGCSAPHPAGTQNPPAQSPGRAWMYRRCTEEASICKWICIHCLSKDTAKLFTTGFCMLR